MVSVSDTVHREKFAKFFSNLIKCMYFFVSVII